MSEISTTPGSLAGSLADSLASEALPRRLREEVGSLLSDYPPSPGPLRLGSWSCTDTRPTRLGPRHYQATLAMGDTTTTLTAAATGPIAALTAMLYDRGIGVEVIDFHQLPAGPHTATLIRGSDGGRAEWAMGVADDPERSALHAVIACANRLLSTG